MTQNQPVLKTSLSDAPLSRLSDTLASDMEAVNDVILRRMDSGVPMIPKLAGYLIAAGGKRIRPLMTLAATRLFDGNTDRPHALAAAVEFIHTATLLHDDVVDESDIRRGQDSANAVFGNKSSVLVGDFLFSRAFQLMVEDGSLDVLRILSNASAIIAEGEVMQLSTSNNLATTMSQYLAMIEAKTAALFAAACEIGPVIAKQTPDVQAALYHYGLALGMAFQIADDVLDYSADQAKLGKTIGDDFREGKVTAPVLVALDRSSDAEKTFWYRTLVDLDQKDDDLQRAQDIFARHNAMDQSLTLAKSWAERAAEALQPFEAHPIAADLQALAFYSVTRAN